MLIIQIIAEAFLQYPVTMTVITVYATAECLFFLGADHV